MWICYQSFLDNQKNVTCLLFLEWCNFLYMVKISHLSLPMHDCNCLNVNIGIQYLAILSIVPVFRVLLSPNMSPKFFYILTPYLVRIYSIYISNCRDGLHQSFLPNVCLSLPTKKIRIYSFFFNKRRQLNPLFPFSIVFLM